MSLTYDMQLMKLMTLFEQRTGARLKDCISPEKGTVMFIVQQGEMPKALGKGGEKARKMSDALGRKVKIIEFNPDAAQFLANVLAPLKPKAIQETDGVLHITSQSLKDRGVIIGREATRLRGLEKIVQRYFPIKEIKVS